MNIERCCEFDAYLIVDWSANNEPKLGNDSIWYCLAERLDGVLQIHTPKNARTRAAAFQQIRAVLTGAAHRNQATLVGFDFPYGYPKGFSHALGLPGFQPWREVWDFLRKEIKDDEANDSNRFQVAARLNQRISDQAFPFWGCPANREGPCLTQKRRVQHTPGGLAEYRMADKSGMQPVWKLCYPGSVGSQALVGIPYVARLRFEDTELSSLSRVWPFETGFRLPQRNERDWTILHAEIHPSILRTGRNPQECKDEAQVRCLAEHFARSDERRTFASLFNPEKARLAADSSAVQIEEGWTLGV